MKNKEIDQLTNDELISLVGKRSVKIDKYFERKASIALRTIKSFLQKTKLTEII